MDHRQYSLRTSLALTLTFVVLLWGGTPASAQVPGENEPTAWTQMMLKFLETGELEPTAVLESPSESPKAVVNFPGVSPIPNLNITPDPRGGVFDQTETTVAIGHLAPFRGTIVVGYNDRAQLNGGFSGYSFSTNGGLTFTQFTGAMPQPAGGSLMGDPVLDTHPTIPGRVYYANLCSGGGNPAGTMGVCVSVSTDGGQTFGAPVTVATATCNVNVMSDCDTFDKEWLAVDSFSGDVYIAYTNFVGGGPPNPMMGTNAVRGQIEAVVCNAALNNCSAPFVVFGPAATFNQGVSVTFGRGVGQEMVLAWYNRTTGNIQSTNCSVIAGPAIGACAAPVVVAFVGTFASPPYADAQATAGCGRPALRAATVPFPGFGAATRAGFRYEPFPVLAADNLLVTAGFTHLVVTFRNSNFLAGATLNDVWYFRSDNDGGAWPVGFIRVNDDPTTATDQFFPHISTPKDDPSGRLNATWYDRRNDFTPGDPNNSNLLIDVFHAESVDRGLNWDSNGQVTDVSFPALPLPGSATNPFCYWGDYIGHASNTVGDHIYAAWGDDRRGQIDTFFAILHNTQDVRVQGALEFGPVVVNPAPNQVGFRDLEFEVLNVGDLNLTVNSVTCFNGNCADFAVLPNPATPLVVRPGAHVSFIVRFKPTTVGPRSATIRVLTNDPDQPTIDLPASGTGVEVPPLTVYVGYLNNLSGPPKPADIPTPFDSDTTTMLISTGGVDTRHDTGVLRFENRTGVSVIIDRGLRVTTEQRVFQLWDSFLPLALAPGQNLVLAETGIGEENFDTSNSGLGMTPVVSGSVNGRTFAFTDTARVLLGREDAGGSNETTPYQVLGRIEVQVPVVTMSVGQ
jgi:hypothetical protein